MKIAGIDLSMSCPAIVKFDCDDEWNFKNFKINYLINTKKYIINHPKYNITGNFIPTNYNSNEERWHLIADWVYNCTKDCVKVNIESQSYGSTGAMLCQISEMHGVVKNYWFKNNINITLTPPSQNKKSFTGKGNATKIEMIDSLKLKYNIDLLQEYNITSNNLHPVEDITDAVALCELLYNNIINN